MWVSSDVKSNTAYRLMTTKEILIAIIIHLIIPLIGLICFLWLNRHIKEEKITNAPTTELFLVFLTYGGLLLVMLTTLFWKWSGMASLGIFYLILVAPFIMGFIAYRHRVTRTISKYHNGIYLSGLLYFIIAPLIFGISFLMSKN